MPLPVPATPRPTPRAPSRRTTVAGLALGAAACLGLAARGLFVQYPDVEWHVAVVRALSGIGVVVPVLLISYLTLRGTLARAEFAKRRAVAVNAVYLSTVETLAAAIDAKDQVRSHDLRKLQALATSLARAVGIREDADLKAIEAAVLLHDMGKVSVPESILNKPGPLTPAEFERVKQHVAVAADILSQVDFPYPILPVVRHHHEHWDGTGYPEALKGEAIPIGARVMAVVDGYDALTSHRPYRAALSTEEAVRTIVARRGTVYDPRVVDAFAAAVRLLVPPGAREAGGPVPSAWFGQLPGHEAPAAAGLGSTAGGCRR